MLSRERELLSDPENEIAVSAASIWELSIKVSQGRLAPTRRSVAIPQNHFTRSVEDLGFVLLAIEGEDAEFIRRLPNLHREPFDRMLIAQALRTGRVLVSRDAVFADYPGVQLFS